MKIVDGVYLHLVKTEKFKTNHLTCRFSSSLEQDNRARRALVAQMLAMATANYPSARLFRQHLAELYGAHLGTRISTRGLTHILDIDISFVDNSFAIQDENILDAVLTVLYEVLFNPLMTVERYPSQVFETEQVNLVNYLEADREDLFYHSELELDQLYFDNPYLREPKYSSPDRVARENSYTAFQEFQRMLKQDRIDIFLVGNVDDYRVVQRLLQFPFVPRQTSLTYQYQQAFSNITAEKLEQRETSQSILQLAYHTGISYGDEAYYSFLVVNGLLGLFPHSLLFSQLREKEGLAYTIGSQFDPYQGVLKIHAGIDKDKRQRTLQLITKQLNHLKSGRFSPDLVRKTKTMLINGLELAQDSHKALVEMTYNKAVLFQDQAPDTKALIAQVSKKDIIAAASRIRLQAVYFLEGED